MEREPLRIGSSYDIHRLKFGNGILLGGVKIPCFLSAVAHSDGDVVFHAASEAIFGGLAIGDLGTYFPPEDEKTINLNSALIMKFAIKKAAEMGYRVCNIDISIILEKPKIMDYIMEIRANIAKVMEIDISQVSVKAGTNEKLPPFDFGEAVSSFATVLLAAK
jgi:2-C-methyl-D-erythritol 2,4-cyclodiphosphate synthase